MTSILAIFEPPVTVVSVGDTHEFDREHEEEVERIESSLHVLDDGLTLSPLLDSHHTSRVIVPVRAEQSELLQVDHGLEFQKYDGHAGVDNSTNTSTLIDPPAVEKPEMST
jgi:hypothetical protein